MSIIRPVALIPNHARPGTYLSGRISQDFDGTYWDPETKRGEKPGYIKLTGVKCGKRTAFTGGVYKPHIHLAIDYACPIGTPVRAVQSGTVLSTGTDSTGGVFVYLRVKANLTNQIVAFYYHLKPGSVRVRKGQIVKQGDIIALSGNSGGVSTGAHLHFTLIRTPRWWTISMIYAKGMRYDPQPFIDGRAMATIL